MSGKRVVVTGGAGFIGSHLVDRLVEAGYLVTVIDDFSTGNMANLKSARDLAPSMEIHNIDLLDPSLTEVMIESSPSYVFHLAAQADVRRSVSDPLHDARVNLLGGVNVVEAARKAGADRVIYAASGGTLYGEPDVTLLPLSESTPHKPLSYYGVSKKGVIDYLFAQSALYGTEFVALALANVYGPRQDPHGESGVISIFAGRLVEKKDCVIYGDGNQSRDFVFVADVVEAFMQSMQLGGCEIVNISSGTETTINQLYWELAQLAGRSEEPVYARFRTGEVQRSCLSNKKAQELLKWTPQVALREGLGEVLDWVATKG